MESASLGSYNDKSDCPPVALVYPVYPVRPVPPVLPVAPVQSTEPGSDTARCLEVHPRTDFRIFAMACQDPSHP